MFRKVLVPLDCSELSESALVPLHRLLAKAEGARATLLHVLPEGLSGDERRRAQEAASAELAKVRERLADWPLECDTTTVEGDPAGAILDAVDQLHPDLLAMATHGRSGLQRLVRGSVAERVLRHAKVPLLLVNPHDLEDESASFQKLLVPLDGSPLADQVLPFAIAIAQAFGASVTLARIESIEPYVSDPLAGVPLIKPRVWDVAAVTETLEPQLKRLQDAGIEARIEARIGEAAHEIVSLAEEHDLVALSSHGRTGASRWWFGSVAEQVVRTCRRPLLLLRGKSE